MSELTQEWLSTMIKVGFTAERGNAWHYRKGDQNHYEGPVPVEVALDLLSFEVRKEPVVVAGTKRSDVAWYAPEYDTVFGYFSEAAKIHPYDEWLLQNTDTLLGGKLAIGGVGLLKNRAVAYLQAEIPETFKDEVTGEAFRSSILSFTSLDSTLATSYQHVFTRVVCDNTFSAASNEKGKGLRIRHTRNSAFSVGTAQEALGMLDGEHDKTVNSIRMLVGTPITQMQWSSFLDKHVPVPEEGRGKAFAETKRDHLQTLYGSDDRVAPWSGTAWGVLQAVNTYHQHLSIIRGTAQRFERNMLNVASGKIASNDDDALKDLDAVLDGALSVV